MYAIRSMAVEVRGEIGGESGSKRLGILHRARGEEGAWRGEHVKKKRARTE